MHPQKPPAIPAPTAVALSSMTNFFAFLLATDEPDCCVDDIRRRHPMCMLSLRLARMSGG
eukprot:6864-Heterococcus_DN1.PRE.2